MDSLTQFTLGAALGQAVLGRKLGWRAALAGGLVATIPDLDVMVPFDDPIADFTYHRGASHSLLVLTVVSPLLAWVCHWCSKPENRDFRRWWLLCWLALFTHPLIDAATIYGTQLFWPITEYPVGTGSIFIIDPAYTLPLLLGVVAALVAGRGSRWAPWFNSFGIALSTLYMACSLLLQTYIAADARQAAVVANIDTSQSFVTPTPFNTLLWRAVIVTPEAYYVAYYSLLTPEQNWEFKAYPNANKLIEDFDGNWAIARLAWFTKGNYAVSERNGEVSMTDLRMGLEPANFVFSFVVADRLDSGEIRPLAKSRRNPRTRIDTDKLGDVWRAVFDGPQSLRRPGTD